MAKVNFNYHLKNIVTQSNDETEKEIDLIRSDTMKQLFLVLIKHIEELITTNEEIKISVSGEIVRENGIIKIKNGDLQIIANEESKPLINAILEGWFLL